MKKSTLFYSSIILIIASFFSACNKSTEEKISQKWKFENIEIQPDPVEMLKSQGVPEEMVEAQRSKFEETISEIVSKSYLTLNEDGTYERYMGNIGEENKPESGSWSVSEDGKTLLVKDDEQEGDHEEIIISELTDSKMILKMQNELQDSGSVTMTLIPAN